MMDNVLLCVGFYVVMLCVILNRYAECNCADCHYAECHYPECYYAEFHCPKCHYVECHCAKCRYAECCVALYLPAFSG
jgi:hypothetical protein